MFTSIKKYLKSFCSVILSLIFMLTCCGCEISKTDLSGNNTSKMLFSTDDAEKKIVPEKLDIEFDRLLGINGKCFYYLAYSPTNDYNRDLADYLIMKYDLTTGKTTSLGEIKNFSTSKLDLAFVNSEKLYFVFGGVENDEFINKHIEVDLNSGGITVWARDTEFPPLIQNISVNEKCFVEYQP